MPSTTTTISSTNGVANGTSHHKTAGTLHHDELLQDASYQATIAGERAKASISFREELAPGLVIDMELKGIHVMTQSKYQKIEVLETCFGKVRVCLCVVCVFMWSSLLLLLLRCFHK